MKQDDNLLHEAISLLKHTWIHRKGNETAAAVLDVIYTIWPNEIKPAILTQNRSGNKWTFIIGLPAGISFNDFKRKEQYFTDFTGGSVSIERNGKAAILEVSTEPLKACYPYEFDVQPYRKMCLPIPFGYSGKGLLVEDLAVFPNLLICGMPGCGKSNFIHTLAMSLLLGRTVCLCLIDLKQLEYSYLEKHALLVTEEEQAKQLLMAINKQLDKRLQILKNAGVVKIQEYPEQLPFIVLIIDELAELIDDYSQRMLNRIVRLGRAAGICCVCATQRPSSTMFKAWGDSKAMFAATLAFRMRDDVNSFMVLGQGDTRAADLPAICGRAVYQYGTTELEIQTMHLPVQKAKRLLKGIQPIDVKRWVDHEQYAKKLLPR